jgi:trans-aconitate methyltransferase
LYLTRRADRAAVLSLLPTHPCRVIDLGCGDGALLRHLARARPDCLFVGLEQAPLSWAWAWLAAHGMSNLSIVHGDFWRHSLSDYDLAYAFLSPAAMSRLWHKARAEMSPGACLISYRFPLPDLTPPVAIAARATGHTDLYCYLPTAGSRSGGADSE